VPTAIDRTGLIRTLDQLDSALADNVERSNMVRERVRSFRDRLRDGATVVGLVEAEESPRTVEMLSSNMAVLETIGADFRADLAHALREEDLTIEAIAGLFGVTRQRISALLRQRSDRA
jgi:predicted XRE-type DNA-binding protein